MIIYASVENSATCSTQWCYVRSINYANIYLTFNVENLRFQAFYVGLGRRTADKYFYKVRTQHLVLWWCGWCIVTELDDFVFGSILFCSCQKLKILRLGIFQKVLVFFKIKYSSFFHFLICRVLQKFCPGEIQRVAISKENLTLKHILVEQRPVFQ